MARTPDLAKRAEIANKVFAHVCEQGVHRITMKSLARLLGMKRSTLYWYYSDLGEIFQAVLEDQLAQQQEFFAPRLEGINDPIDFLQAYTRTAAEFNARRRKETIAMFQLWAVSSAESPDLILERARTFLQPLRHLLIDRLTTGIENETVSPCDPVQVVDLVLTICDGLGVQRITMDSEQQGVVDFVNQQILEPLRVARVSQLANQSSPTGRAS